MRLSGTFFTVISTKETENGSEPRLVSPVEPLIRLEPGNVIFKAHFPDYPITPGAVQIRVATELLENHLGKGLTLARVGDLKFMEGRGDIFIHGIGGGRWPLESGTHRPLGGKSLLADEP